MTIKGIILAGGSGTRLYPLTNMLSKQLLPIYDKPMVYYPLSTLMLSGIRDILIITTPQHRHQFEGLLGDGGQWGIDLSYAEQPNPNGLAEAFIIGRDFIGENRCALILGDNVFYGHGLTGRLQGAARRACGATVFAHKVSEPQRYGIVEFCDGDQPLRIIEKPQTPPSSYAVTGLYFYDNDVVDHAATLQPSARGELEITELNNRYLKRGNLSVEVLGRGFTWFDAGTPQSLLQASEFVQTVETRQGLKICCVEEIAYMMGYISAGDLEALARPLQKSGYGGYLLSVLQENLVHETL